MRECFRLAWVLVAPSFSNHLALEAHRCDPSGGGSSIETSRKASSKSLKSKRRRRSTVGDRGRCSRSFRTCFSKESIRGSETHDNIKGKVTVLKYIR